MPIQAPQWTDYLSCPVCEKEFNLKERLPASLGCGHSFCKACLAKLQRKVCPYDQTQVRVPSHKIPTNTAIIRLLDAKVDLEPFRQNARSIIEDAETRRNYASCMPLIERLASLLPKTTQTGGQILSRPMQRKLVSLINSQILEDEGRARSVEQFE